ncbi:helix-turn-helix domain containing protein [Pacificitalea manganoxidans]|uniref:Helix-turn-helix domain containing protein n=1 Tax=Pacificitalea manganoxidans TaxID=1411902 RepID=A0A291M007_9RHOB|nr:DUF6456 domain-containing protein [Pacificitalea manganoxidans]ATI42108.1 helix-turn-helix domain containing protein [Pacificitalea manganoxidans]MDR6308090.1 DNA-binding PadR family transcriptional regulator [Pacificitalea manganoxidans]
MSQNVELPGWIPDSAWHYVRHTESGLPIRAVARDTGCHASTILRQIRRYEQRRDDPLVDEALARLGQVSGRPDVCSSDKEPGPMTAQFTPSSLLCDDATVMREARRILRRLLESGAFLAVAQDMEKAAVMRALEDGRTMRTAVVTRQVAQAFALKEWIVCSKPGRVASYRITPAGRAALKRLLAQDGRGAAGADADGFAEAQAPFAAQHRDMTHRDMPDPDGGAQRKRVRYNMAESPVVALARRRDKQGRPFLSPEQVSAAERLREDFELAQMGPRVTQNWDRFLTAGSRGGFSGDTGGQGSQAARSRVARALADLGPGLGDVALRCCCFLDGLEVAEQRMGWSARSGKIVLRIALDRLARHYQDTYGPGAGMIG